ncbi:MAG: glycoside hydrolase family 3 C-terminal domain-containing protein [Propionibacteriaceae bacterium]|jgi:beta-glucosidase|nr:glycoside hydrolase family 3 C-terminal domain-containing protein [Propionibacteriaceae bacterium]
MSKRNSSRHLVAKMTLKEKAALCAGRDWWHIRGLRRLGVPEVRVADGPHGLRVQTDDVDPLGGINISLPATCFPPASALAASFDVDLVREVGKALGEECQAQEVNIVLGPAINIKRSPLGGRNFEYFSEDPCLVGHLAGAYIEGVQSQGVGTSLKHFAANNQEHQRMTISETIDERTLREIYLPGFETAVKQGHPWTVMSSYNLINSVYVGESHHLLTEVMRDEWGFDGLVVSDWGAVNDRVAGLLAGLDVEMPGPGDSTSALIAQAVKQGRVPVEVLDQAVERIIDVAQRAEAGRRQFEKDGRESGDGRAGDLYERHHQVAVKAATESAILLKNEGGTLPLANEQETVFIGEFAAVPRFEGGGSSHVNATRIVSAVEAAADLPGVSYQPGFPAQGDQANRAWHEEAVQAAAKAQVAVIFAGLPESYESEGYDRSHMRLPQCQDDLISAVVAVQPNTVVVLHNGSVVEMPWAGDVRAILEMYLGGQGVGQASVDLLFGRVNPSGKLPETAPLKLADNPSYLNFPGDDVVEYREGVFVGYRYYDTKSMEVQFPFGHGLSFTQFAYSQPRLNAERFDSSGPLVVEVDVTNIGAVAGKEVVQLYVAPPSATRVPRPIHELKGFVKVDLKPGATVTARFELGVRAFSYWDVNTHDWARDEGDYVIEVGSSSRDIRGRATVAVPASPRPKLVVDANTRVEQLLAEPATRGLLTQAMKMMGMQESGEGPDFNPEMAEAGLAESPLRQLRSFNGFSDADLNALIGFFNARIGNTKGAASIAAHAKIIPALVRVARRGGK